MIVDAVLKGVEVDVFDVIRDKVECDDDEDVLEIAELLVEVIVDVEVFVDVVDIEKGCDDRGEREIVVVFVDVFDNVDVREGKISFTERYLISEGSIPLIKKREENKSNIRMSNILLRFFPKPLVWFSGFLVFWFSDSYFHPPSSINILPTLLSPSIYPSLVLFAPSSLPEPGPV